MYAVDSPNKKTSSLTDTQPSPLLIEIKTGKGFCRKNRKTWSETLSSRVDGWQFYIAKNLLTWGQWNNRGREPTIFPPL